MMMFGMFGVGLLLLLLVIALPVILVILILTGGAGFFRRVSQSDANRRLIQPSNNVTIQPNKVDSVSRFCAHCGAGLQPGWSHCPQCGAPIHD